MFLSLPFELLLYLLSFLDARDLREISRVSSFLRLSVLQGMTSVRTIRPLTPSTLSHFPRLREVEGPVGVTEVSEIETVSRWVREMGVTRLFLLVPTVERLDSLLRPIYCLLREDSHVPDLLVRVATPSQVEYGLSYQVLGNSSRLALHLPTIRAATFRLIRSFRPGHLRLLWDSISGIVCCKLPSSIKTLSINLGDIATSYVFFRYQCFHGVQELVSVKKTTPLRGPEVPTQIAPISSQSWESIYSHRSVERIRGYLSLTDLSLLPRLFSRVREFHLYGMNRISVPLRSPIRELRERGYTITVRPFHLINSEVYLPNVFCLLSLRRIFSRFLSIRDYLNLQHAIPDLSLTFLPPLQEAYPSFIPRIFPHLTHLFAPLLFETEDELKFLLQRKWSCHTEEGEYQPVILSGVAPTKNLLTIFLEANHKSSDVLLVFRHSIQNVRFERNSRGEEEIHVLLSSQFRPLISEFQGKGVSFHITYLGDG